jgi:hypothetical protein
MGSHEQQSYKQEVVIGSSDVSSNCGHAPPVARQDPIIKSN